MAEERQFQQVGGTITAFSEAYFDIKIVLSSSLPLFSFMVKQRDKPERSLLRVCSL
jgi:hypothetical protein